ncbi:MAG TPA: squalene/phytoene synthase family protein [Chloroflexi bacterium]|jgi:phytoene synthase|nr:squalene/phytoene synthase family protein [Chloroflexota bacterium]
MSTRASSWEQRLLSWANEALDNLAPTLSEDRVWEKSNESERVDSEGGAFSPSRRLLIQAYRYCRKLTRFHSRTFYMASSLLPRTKRNAVRALYAFCRTTDDLVDHAAGDVRSELESWRRRALADHPTADDPVTLAWTDTRTRYGIPPRYAEQLIDGVAQDLAVTRYRRFDDLAGYCYGVASTVGLMAMYIVGFVGTEAIPYAVKLGVALQLTNILRDVGEDWRMGRLYLPLDELADYGLDEDDIAAGRVDDRWRAFMRFQIARTHRLYDEAMPGLAMLHRDGRFAIAAAAELYRGILEEIETHGGDVFHHRAHLSTWDKLRRLPGIWRRSLSPV